jgi:dienelactone hydrolase
MTATSPSQYISTFYTSEKALEKRFRQSARQMAFAGETRAEALAWQKKARRQLARRLGLQHFEAVAPRPVKVGSTPMVGYAREEWRIQTERDVWLPFYLLVPDAVTTPAPLVICPHGHGSAGKWATAGRNDIAAMQPIIAQFNYDYGVQLARAGFITACPDARGFGERREPALQYDCTVPDYLAASSCHHLTVAGAPLGLTVQGMWTWDLMRLLDFLVLDARVDNSRIGCAGLSGGGLQTLDFAALDTRVRAAVVSGYFYGVRESLQILNSNCLCNMVPGLWEDFDMGDIGALIAPRGLFIETGDEDPLNGKSKVKNVRSQLAISRKVFKALSAEKQLAHHVFHGEHRWDGTRSIPWLQKQLQF